MKTLKEIKEWFNHSEKELTNSYYEWYKDAIEWIFNDIINADWNNSSLQIYLYKLLTK